VVKYIALEQFNEDSSMSARKSLERNLAVVEKAQVLISDDPGQSLRVLMDVVEIVASGKPYFSAGRCTGSYELFGSKLALRQCR